MMKRRAHVPATGPGPISANVAGLNGSRSASLTALSASGFRLKGRDTGAALTGALA